MLQSMVCKLNLDTDDCADIEKHGCDSLHRSRCYIKHYHRGAVVKWLDYAPPMGTRTVRVRSPARALCTCGFVCY